MYFPLHFETRRMQAIIFIGIQATGKSTFYKTHFYRSHVRISMDLLNTRNKENKFLETCFETHTQFVVDNTNPSRKEREKYIQWAKENKYEVIGYYFSISMAEAIQRNENRPKEEQLPEVGIRGCRSRLELPSLEEGFDKLYFVNTEHNEFHIRDWKDEI